MQYCWDGAKPSLLLMGIELLQSLQWDLSVSDGTATEQRGGSIATVLTCRVFHPLFSHTSSVKQLYTKLTANGFRTCTFCLTAAILVMINTSTRTNCENWEPVWGNKSQPSQSLPTIFFSCPLIRCLIIGFRYCLGFAVYTGVVFSAAGLLMWFLHQCCG